MTKIWLDDERDPNKFGAIGWVWIKTAEDCITYLQVFWDEITEISLDHDLGDTTAKTGYDVAKWIEEKVIVDGWRLPIVRVHSQNPVGRARMDAALVNATKFVTWKR